MSQGVHVLGVSVLGVSVQGVSVRGVYVLGVSVQRVHVRWGYVLEPGLTCGDYTCCVREHDKILCYAYWNEI